MHRSLESNQKSPLRRLGLVSAMVFLTFLSFGVWAYDTKNPTEYDIAREKKKIENVGIDQNKLGSIVDLDLVFSDENGESKPLKEFFLPNKPILLSIVYYKCPGLCNYHMNGVVAVLDDLKLNPNKDYRWVTVSMDVTETPDLAKDKKATYVDQELKKQFWTDEDLAKGWAFLTGSKENVEKLTKQLGFTYRWDAETMQFAHAAAIYTLTPDGKISKIISGIEFEPQTVRLSLVEAAKGQIGSVMDKIALFCFKFNPKKNKYTVYAYNFMKVGGALTVLLILIFLGPYWYQLYKSERAKEN